MVAPLVPRTKSTSITNVLYRYYSGYSQKAPYNLNTTLVLEWGVVTGGPYIAATPVRRAVMEAFYGSTPFTLAQNRVLKNLDNQLGDQTSLGATLTAEGRETARMLSGTVIRLFLAARAARKLRFTDMSRHLGIPLKEETHRWRRHVRDGQGRVRRLKGSYVRYRLPDGRTVARNLGGAWLFWSYGAKPLASDIYNGLDLLTRKEPHGKHKATVKFPLKHDYYYINPQGFWTREVFRDSVRMAAGRTVTVSNLDRFMLRQMGLDNPLSWVLEAIPLSFVADWFSNLSEVVQSLAGYGGLSINDRWFTVDCNADHAFSSWDRYNGSRAYRLESLARTRALSNPTIKLKWAYEPPNWQRGLNAISLLLQQLRS